MREIDYRFIVAALLVFYVVTVFATRGRAIARSAWRPAHGTLRNLLQLARFTGPLIYVFSPTLPVLIRLRLAHLWRIEGAVMAALVVIWSGWSYYSLSRAQTPAELTNLRGPYRWLRHPALLGDGLFFLCIALISAEGLTAWITLGSVLAVRFIIVPAEEEQLRQLDETAFEAYQQKTGGLLFKVASFRTRQYRVPSRFGLSAILALITVFGMLFGFLNYSNAPPAVYLFLGLQVVSICLVQILFESAPRGGSALTGLVILPLCVGMTVDWPNWVGIEIFLACLFFLTLCGAFFGYCMGTLAAGFFLVTDLAEDYLLNRSNRKTIQSDAASMVANR